MARDSASRKALKSGATLSRLPHLADRLLHANLLDELRQLREAESWQRETGRSSRTLAKYPDFRIVLVLMKRGSQMKEHHTDARISIQTLEGRIRVRVSDQSLELGAGGLMCLESGIHHTVEALEESGFLITVSWPGGSAEERHALS